MKSMPIWVKLLLFNSANIGSGTKDNTTKELNEISVASVIVSLNRLHQLVSQQKNKHIHKYIVS